MANCRYCGPKRPPFIVYEEWLFHARNAAFDNYRRIHQKLITLIFNSAYFRNLFLYCCQMLCCEIPPAQPKHATVVFLLEGQHFGLRLESVERLIRAVEVTSLPPAPEIVEGVINLQGRIIAVLNLRTRLGLRQRELDPDQHFIIARATSRCVAIRVDRVSGVIELTASSITMPDSIVPGVRHISGVSKLDDGMLFIHDPDHFLSLEEGTHLDHALEVHP